MSAYNNTFSSKNFSSRNGNPIKFLILHFTNVPLGTTLGILSNDPALSDADAEYFVNTSVDRLALCQREVSVHYVNSEAGEIFQLVDEQYVAHHAGTSCWDNIQDINTYSIGIEHVNIGTNWLNKFPHDRGVIVPGSTDTWCKYSEAQIEATLDLCQDVINRHNILPCNVLGHSDIAPGRKFDPGPLFPWQRLAEAGIGMWYDRAESTIAAHMPDNSQQWFQNKLAAYGYAQAHTTATVQAFQMHFRPANIDGKIDLECMQIIDSLCLRKTKIPALV